MCGFSVRAGCFDARSDELIRDLCTLYYVLFCLVSVISELEVANVGCLYLYEPHFDILTHTHCPARSNLRETSRIGRNRQEDSGKEDDVIIHVGS